MGKTTDLTVVQKTITDTLHKEGKPQTFIVKEAGKLSGRKSSFPVAQLVEHGASNAKIMGSIPRESKS